MTDKSRESLIFRFKGLIRAIEFFSQRFDADQIIHYAVDFIDELMIIDKVAVFALEEGFYVPVKQRGYDVQDYSIEATRDLKDIVVLHAGLFHPDDLLRFFPDTLSDQFPCRLGIPLIMDKQLYGFIVLDRREADGPFDADDRIVATALMNLFYTSLTNYQSYDELIRIKKKLDEKIFNLFAINQSSKVLMGTLEIEDICSLSISVFSELTQSAITSMFIYDDLSEAYKMMAIQNVFELNQAISMSAYQTDELVRMTYKSYYDMSMEEERLVFEACFHNSGILLDALEPKYLVPVYKNDHLLGFITLGKRVNDAVYNEGIIELVESLSSSLYVSISNAMQVKVIQEQKGLIDSKLEKLMRLNMLIKNINTSSDASNLMTITKDTLDLSFGVKCGLIAQYNSDTDDFTPRETIACDKLGQTFKLEKVMNQLYKGKKLIANSIAETEDLLGVEFTRKISGHYSGALIVPIFLDKYELELIGVLCIFDMGEQLIGDSANVLMFESVANAIAPVWYQLSQMEHMKEVFVANGSTTFKEELLSEMADADDFDLELHVFLVAYKAKNCLDQGPMFETIEAMYPKSHKIDNSHMMVITGVVSDEEGLKELLDQAYVVTHYDYKKDFKDYQSFLEQLS